MLQESQRRKMLVALRVLREWINQRAPKPGDLELLGRFAEPGEEDLMPDDLARAVIERVLNSRVRSGTA
jgi:hypothetical protein